MEQMTIAYLGSLIILSFAILLLVFKNVNDKKEFKLMEFKHNSELDKYKVYELSKTQMDQDYEIRLKQVEFDKDQRDFDRLMLVTKEEREYMLNQRRLEVEENKHNAENLLQTVWPYIEKNNEHVLKIAQVQSPVDNILSNESIKNLNIKKK